MNIWTKNMTLIAYLFLTIQPAKNVVRSMWKKSRFRLPFQKKHAKRVSTHLKSERQHLYHIHWSMGRILSSKKSLLVIWKILNLFLKTLSAVDKYSLLNRYNRTKAIQMQLSQKQKHFLNIFQHILNLVEILNILEKKITLIPYVFLSWRLPKNVVRSMSKKSRLRLPFQKEHAKRASTLLKSERQHLYHIYWSMGMQLNCKKPLLFICKILRLFVNTLSAVAKYSLPNRDNLTQPIQMQLSQKEKAFY